MSVSMIVGALIFRLLVIHALQLSKDYDVVTPANWQQGEKVILPFSASDQEINEETMEG